MRKYVPTLNRVGTALSDIEYLGRDGCVRYYATTEANAGTFIAFATAFFARSNKFALECLPIDNEVGRSDMHMKDNEFRLSNPVIPFWV